jgi:hypothetical protein
MNRYSEKLIGENINLWAMVWSFIAIGGGLVLWYIHTLIVEPFSILVRGLAETIMIAGVVAIIYERFIKIRFKVEMESAILNSLNADAGLLKSRKLNNEAVNSIIKNCLEARLCNREMADIFYNGLISPYISIDKFRKTFDYRVEIITLDNDINISDIKFDKKSYFRVVEKLTYKKRITINKDGGFIIGLCLNDSQLKHYMGKECIYRTIFRVRENEKRIMETTPIPEIIFQLMVKINDKELEPIMTGYDSERGIKINFKGFDGPIHEEVETEFEIEVITLRSKALNYYTAYLYDPSFSPKIEFRYNDEMKNVFALSYFTTGKDRDVIPKPDPPTKSILVAAKDMWAFPTSGVVFIWE